MELGPQTAVLCLRDRIQASECNRKFLPPTCLGFAEQSHACQTDLARLPPRRCADPGRSVAADSPGNPPIRRVVCLPRAARGYPPGRGDTGRAAVGRAAVGRAGSFKSGRPGRSAPARLRMQKFRISFRPPFLSAFD